MSYSVLYNRTIIFGFTKKHALKSHSKIDNQTLLDYYNIAGDKLPSLLNGSFAFAFYKASTDTYYCARDHLGINELYYTEIDSSYYFSNDIEELLSLRGERKPNISAMSSMLYQMTVPYEETMYEEIYRIPPAHYLIIQNGKKELKRYWFPEKIDINYNISENEAALKIQTLLQKAVKRRTENIQATAFQLSGGLDSSSIVSAACQQVAPENIDCYSMTFTSLKCDEGEYIDAVEEKYKCPIHRIAPLNTLDYKTKYSLKMLYSFHPHWPINSIFASSLFLFEQVVKSNKKIVLTGQGGDHLFTGSPKVLSSLFSRLEFSKVLTELKPYSNPLQAVKSYIVKPILEEKEIFNALIKKPYQELFPFFSKNTNIKELTDIVEIDDKLLKTDINHLTCSSQSTIMDGNIFHSVEKNFGVELRHPFFDIELVEYALSLPPEFKYQHRTIKWILRKAMKGILPEKIRNRKDKAEFSEVIFQQIAAIDLDKLFKDPYIVQLGIISKEKIDMYLGQYKNHTLKYVLILWSIINVEYWYRYNFQPESLE